MRLSELRLAVFLSSSFVWCACRVVVGADGGDGAAPDIAMACHDDWNAPCFACPAGQLCRGNMPALYSFPPQCLRPCTTQTDAGRFSSSDCAPGEHCILVLGAHPVRSEPAFCFSDKTLTYCPPAGGDQGVGFSCDYFPAPGCYDGDHLVQRISLDAQQICGDEIIHCSNGCEPANGNVAAHCRPPGSDGGVDPTCHLDSGRACDGDIGCPDNNGCNWCGCTVNGSPTANHLAACNMAACVSDGGARPRQACQSRADCAVGDTCVWQPGCMDKSGLCTRATACNSSGTGNPPSPGAHTICDCNGNDVVVQILCGVEQPYRRYGKCQ